MSSVQIECHTKRVHFAQTGSFQFLTGTIWDPELNKMCHYRDLIKHHNPVIRLRWTKSGEKEFGRLCQGFEKEEGMDVIQWIPKTDMPSNKKAGSRT